ncbi:MAG: 23S rRNA (uracil(1939)-C(5))-methyltransferase RlmD [Lachnospiraceae bacterium]|nr:23S rRNA (uracil(1939)-C(5))-methyltransferase RlmD [Lachnospiraceae bacterium]
MKKGQIYEGVVERVEFPNKGIIRCEEETAVVKNVIPGQKVSFLVNKKRKGKAEGRLLEVLEKAPYEQESDCLHFAACGGCAYQNVPYEKQLELKESQVRKLLQPAFEKQMLLEEIQTEAASYINQIFEGIKESPVQRAYRNKMEFSFGDEYRNGPLALGMHKRGSFYDIVSVRDCCIVDEDYRRVLACVLDYFLQQNSSYFHKIRHEGYLRHLLVRKAQKTGEMLIALVTSTQETHDLALLVAQLLKLPLDGKITGVLHTKNDSLADVVQSDETVILYGQDYFYEELLGLRFKISQFSFFQTNTLGAEVLYETARDFLGDISGGGKRDKTIFDLYSGTGTIAQILAPVAKKVIGVELVEEAVLAARQNAKLNGLENCEFIAGDVLKVLDELEDKPDFIVLDPPRDGIPPKALKKIIEYQVDRIVYISCKPTSLARDLEALLDGGYRMERVVAVDQFPQTANVETVCLLSKLHADHHIEVELQMDELDLTAAESKATYEEIKDYVLAHAGLKVSSLYIAQVKEKCGIIERMNYNLPKSENSRQPKCPPEKEAAIREALEHFRMI